MTQPIPARLAKLARMKIQHGAHTNFKQGHCALELVAWLAGEEHSASPQCASPNDRFDIGLARQVLELTRPWVAT